MTSTYFWEGPPGWPLDASANRVARNAPTNRGCPLSSNTPTLLLDYATTEDSNRVMESSQYFLPLPETVDTLRPPTVSYFSSPAPFVAIETPMTTTLESGGHRSFCLDSGCVFFSSI